LNGRLLKSSVPCVLGAVALAGCGSSSSSPSTTPSTNAGVATPPVTKTSTPATATTPPPAPAAKAGTSKVTLQADPSGGLMFNQKSLTASAGTVTIDFENTSSTPHNVTVASSAGAVLGSTPTFTGGSRTLTLKLAKGTYTYYCSVPGHEQAGMKGTLKVN
jgi:plastocyanin